MSQGSSSYGGAPRRRVLCPNCNVLANRFISTTRANPNRAFHKCPYFAIGGCQYYQWEDEMGETATPIQAVPLQAVAAPGGFPTAPPLAILQEGSQAAVVEGHAPMDKRVQQQLRRIEKLVYLCLVLALYAIFKK
ncbi:uncharacterized protein [Miscanthus floridulus]|uniref:uncharacterized protein n=1 Tax=Miscanthus floridulus TaxID=154761 RepID=UPI003459ED4C